jgi:dTDP-4-amino-4,6-dideoxygalactose transaminase
MPRDQGAADAASRVVQGLTRTGIGLGTIAKSGIEASEPVGRSGRAVDALLPIVSPEGIPDEQFVCYVRRILESRQLTNGTFVREFERAAASYLGVPCCVAVSSCTLGLVLTLAALDLRGEVILPSFTFHATAHAVAWNGLTPVFADCDSRTFCIDPNSVRRCITRKTAAILAVHLFGNPAGVLELEDIARTAGVPLIYDGAHAFGGKAGERHVGTFGTAEVFSFSPTKLVVAGEGGLIATRDATIAKRLRAARNYGDAGDGDPEVRGLNARMSEFHAALALGGLGGIEGRIERRNRIRCRYESRLGQIPGIRFQQICPANRSACKDFSLIVDEQQFGRDRDWLFDLLRQENIDVRRYFWPPVHRQKLYRSIWDGRPLPVTDYLSDRVVSLPIYSSLRDADLDRVCDAVLRAADFARAKAAGAGL